MHTTNTTTLLQEYLDLATEQRDKARALTGDQAQLDAVMWERRIARIQVGMEDTTPSEPFQEQVRPWLHACFGEDVANDKSERNHRYLEESLELVQACGATEAEAHELVSYVFSRPKGECDREVGGVMLTLAALCLAHDVDMDGAAAMELASVWTRIGSIRAKWESKQKGSPLPSSAVASRSGVGHLCTVGPADSQRQVWLLRFEDRDRGEAVHSDQGAAYQAFGRAETLGWNCHLFQLAPRKPELAALGEYAMVPRAVLDAFPDVDATLPDDPAARAINAWCERVVHEARPAPVTLDLKKAGKLVEGLESGAFGYQQDQQVHTARRLDDARKALMGYLKEFA